MIQSVRFCIVFLTEHKVFDILSLSLTHTERGLPLPGCRSIIPTLRIFFNRVSIPPHFEHLLSACLTDTWAERICVNKILFNVVYSQNNMLLMVKSVIFCVV